MFKKIVISVPQEQFPELAMKRGGELSDRLDSRIFMSYIIEDTVFNEVASKARHVLTESEKRKFEKKMIKTHEKVAKKVILKEAENILGEEPDEFSVEKGMFTDSLLRTIEENDADTLLMEYRSYNLMKFRIMDRSPVPVWIERHEGPIKKIGLFCTNISPNKRAPKAAVILKKAYNAKLSAYFINDPVKNANKVEPSEITKNYRIKWKEVVEEKVDRFIYQKAREMDFDLIILGRIKKRGYFHLRSKFAKKTDCSVLLVN